MSGVRKSFKAKLNRKKSNFFIAGILSVLVFVGAFAERKLTSLQEDFVKGDLRKTIRANAEALHLELDSYKRSAQTAGALPEIKALVEELNGKAKLVARENWLELKGSSELNIRLNEICKTSGFEEYFLLNQDGYFTSATKDYFVGHRVPRQEVIKQLMKKGGVHLTLPKYHVLAETQEQREELVMFIAVVVKNNHGEGVGVLAMRIDPNDGFTRVLQASKTEDLAETFAVNSDGYMISASRFEEDLRKRGLLKEGQLSSVLNIHVGNYEQRGVARVEYPEIRSSLEGYTSYRGERVVGARTYLPEYDFEIITELDYDKAYHSLFIVRVIFWSLFGVATAFALGLALYSLWAVKMKAKVQAALLEAKELGQFKLSEKLGEGSMGVVYRAEHKLMRRKTALKLLKKEVAGELDLKLFEKEVQMTCRLTHPNTICIYDYGQTDEGIFYYAMEYLNGLSLRLLINDTGPMMQARAIYIMRKICASLHEAHSIGLIHRDIKADNVVLCKQAGIYDVVKVLDFGLVRDLAGLPDELYDKISGTPRYISPEAIDTPSEVDARTDIYALGILLCLMVTGKYPFPDVDNQKDMLLCHLNDQPTKPSELVRYKISEGIDELVLWCLEKDRNLRPQNVMELDAKLASLEGSWDESKAAKWWSGHGHLLDDGVETNQTIDKIEKTIKVIP